VPPPESRPLAPLRVWYIAAALAAAAWLVAWLAATEAGAQLDTPFTEFNRERLAAFDARATSAGARRVILLGSSALKYATRDERAFAASVSTAVGEPVAVLRIASNWGSFYEFAPLTGDILRAKPDLVVMDSEFLAVDRPRIRRFLSWIQHARRSLGVTVQEDIASTSEADVQFAYPCWKRKVSRPLDRLLDVREDWIAVRPDGPGPRGARRLVEALLATDARAAFVAIPRRPDYDSVSRRTRQAGRAGSQGRSLAGRVPHWEPAPVPIELYCDLTHVQPAGQARISDWLEAKVAAALSHRRPEPSVAVGLD